MRSWRWLILGLLVGGACMVLAFWGVPMADFLAALGALHPGWLVGMSVLFLAQEALRAVRQQVLLGPDQPPLGFVDSLGIVFVSFFCISLFPGRLGELVRPALLAHRHDIPIGTGVGMVAAERVIDLVAALAMLAAVLILVETPETLELAGQTFRLAELGSVLGLTLVLPAVVGTTSLVLFGAPFLALLRRVLDGLAAALPTTARLCGQVSDLAGAFVEGLAGLRDPGRLALILGLTVLIWVDATSIYWLLSHGFGLSDQVGFGEAMGVMVVTMFGSLLPAPPGMAGVQEAFGRAGLALYGVHGAGQDAIALAYAVVAHWWMVVLEGVFALWFMRRWGQSLRGLASSARAVEDEALEP